MATITSHIFRKVFHKYEGDDYLKTLMAVWKCQYSVKVKDNLEAQDGAWQFLIQ